MPSAPATAARSTHAGSAELNGTQRAPRQSPSGLSSQPLTCSSSAGETRAARKITAEVCVKRRALDGAWAVRQAERS